MKFNIELSKFCILVLSMTKDKAYSLQVKGINNEVFFSDLCALVFDSHDSSKVADQDYYENMMEWFGLEYSDYASSCDDFAYFSDYSNVEMFAASGNGKSKK